MNTLPSDWNFDEQAAEATLVETGPAEAVVAGGDSSHFQLLLQVGAGAMGEVYLAEDRDLLRKVAYKRLLGHLGANAEVLTRFVREVQITAQLEHPNVVPVYQLEKSPDGLAYAMKLVFGQTLKELIQAARLAEDASDVPESLRPRALFEHFLKVCAAMDFAHQRGVIHRDLKPANIMVGRFHEVYVMDWGIARVIGSDHDAVDVDLAVDTTPEGFEQTQAGKILGTPRYLSPEQATGRNAQLTGHSDQFTLGLILYELASLRPAYSAGNLTELLKKVLKADTAPLNPYVPSRPIPRELAAIIAKATARSPQARYPSVGDLAEDLRRFLAGQAVVAEPDRPWQAFLRWCAQHQALASALIGTGLLLLGLGAFGSLWAQSRRSLRQAQEQGRLGQLQTLVSRQAQEINNQLMKVSVLLQGLTAAASQSLAGQPLAGPIYTQKTYVGSGSAPADFRLATAYNKLISLREPVYGSAEGPAGREFARLRGLRSLLPELLARAGGLPPGSPAFERAVRQQGVPVTWASLALENGDWLAFPGQAGYPENYDPRRYAWYRLGQRSPQPIWGPPFADSQGQGLLLPVVQRLPNQQGVAQLSLRFTYLIDQLMNLPLEGSRESFLLDARGQIMVRSSERSRMVGMGFGAFRPQQVMDTPLFDRNAVVEAIQRGGSGLLRYQRDGRPVLLAFYRLSALGWYYAIEVDQDLFLHG